MISPVVIKLIDKLPKGMVKFFGNKILNGYIDKYAKIQITGRDNLNNIKRPAIFICNHLSNSDALVLEKVLKDEAITYVAGAKLSNTSLTNIGISIVKTITIKPNTADKEAITNIIKTIKNGSSICMFPEGTRSRTGALIEPKRGIILIAKLAGVNIVPIGISGTEKLLPINQENMGGEKFHNADVVVNIGKPIELFKKSEGEDKHQYEKRLVDFLMINIARLLPKEYRGVYSEICEEE